VNRVSNDKLVDGDGRWGLEPDEQNALEAAGIDFETVTNRACSYRRLLDAGVDETIADSLRRRLSLPWSFEPDGDLDRRSSEVRGLGEAERQWIEASGDDGWQAFDNTDTRDSDRESTSREERPWPRPTPVTAVTGVGPADADRLAEAGIISAERLATVGAVPVADALELDVIHVRAWRHNARELLD